MTYGLIGEHLPHSFSKEIHAKCASYDYILKELTPEEVGPFMEKGDFSAINVTIPYKQTVMPYLTEIHRAAKDIGAVNTVVNKNGKLYGYNTDFYGLLSLLRHAGISLGGRKVMVLGDGGTARTARAVARAEGAAAIVTVERRPKSGSVSYEEAVTLHSDAEVIFNTTPVGMYPYADGAEHIAAVPIDVLRFPRLVGVVDAVYNPLRTNLVSEARAAGIPAEGGLYMLVGQAVVASRVFLGEDFDTVAADPETDALTARIFRLAACEKENLVLTGMPSSGKSTVGALLARDLGRPFIDTDAEIVKAAGCDIPTIFRERGESGFRALEREVVSRIANGVTGAVIATGGGAILDDGNVRALGRTGRRYFLDRPLSALLPTDDRPLASSREAIRRRYEERYGRYLATCDLRVPNEGTAEEAALLIRKDFFHEDTHH
ncbi:MAG: shikimate dehydrogenase [Clostridia bacterium]|nr:shikimate dehydrogenase [Clostridia bacterium]